jgi:putative membrane protein
VTVPAVAAAASLLAATPAPSPWEFHLHPEVVGVTVFLLAGYGLAVRRWGPLFHPASHERPATTRQKAAFVAGAAAFFVAVGWPVHDLGERYLYSAHMLQHILLGYVAPPLLLLGTPEWLGRLVLGRGVLGRLYRRLASPLLAAVAFNAALAFIHWPAVVDRMLASEGLHAGTHLVFVAGAVLMWSVLYSPLPEVAGQLRPPAKMLYLFVQTILPTVPASFLTFGQRTLYRAYETMPRLWGLTPRDDMQLAGLLMKVGAGLLLWSIIAVMFFRWANQEEVSGVGGSPRGGGSGPRPWPYPADPPPTRWSEPR